MLILSLFCARKFKPINIQKNIVNFNFGAKIQIQKYSKNVVNFKFNFGAKIQTPKYSKCCLRNIGNFNCYFGAKIQSCKLHKSEGKTNPEWLRLLLILFTVAFPVTFTLIALVLLQLALILAMVVFGSLVKKSVWTTTRKTNPATLDTQNKSFFKANISMLETQLRRIHFGFGRQKVTSLII